jgi:cytochrome c556
MLILGLAIGVFGTVTMLSGLRQQTPYSKAVMAVSGQNFNRLRQMPDSGQCDAERIAASVHTLAALGHDIEPAFLPTGADDALFLRHLKDHRARVDRIAVSPPTQCDALREAVRDIGAGCKGCHQDFKP